MLMPVNRGFFKITHIFLSKLKKADRVMFVRRYWFLETVSEIAGSIGRSNNYVTVHLHRSRKKLENYLKMKGLIQ